MTPLWPILDPPSPICLHWHGHILSPAWCNFFHIPNCKLFLGSKQFIMGNFCFDVLVDLLPPPGPAPARPCVIWWHCLDPTPPPAPEIDCHVLFEWQIFWTPSIGGKKFCLWKKCYVTVIVHFKDGVRYWTWSIFKTINCMWCQLV